MFVPFAAESVVLTRLAPASPAGNDGRRLSHALPTPAGEGATDATPLAAGSHRNDASELPLRSRAHSLLVRRSRLGHSWPGEYLHGC